MPRNKKLDARLGRVLRGFYQHDRQTQKRQIADAMAVLDPEQKVWRQPHRDADFKRFMRRATGDDGPPTFKLQFPPE